MMSRHNKNTKKMGHTSTQEKNSSWENSTDIIIQDLIAKI